MQCSVTLPEYLNAIIKDRVWSSGKSLVVLQMDDNSHSLTVLVYFLHEKTRTSNNLYSVCKMPGYLIRMYCTGVGRNGLEGIAPPSPHPSIPLFYFLFIYLFFFCPSDNASDRWTNLSCLSSCSGFLWTIRRPGW